MRLSCLSLIRPPMLSYLENLTIRLATSVAELPETVRERHIRFFETAQRSDGGFAGREGESDLYYTGFGVRSLALLGRLHGSVAERAATFLKSRLGGKAPIIDFLSLIYAAALLDMSAGINVFADAAPGWREAVSASLEQLRRPDGGYAKGPEGTQSSTYHTFLVVLCRELLDVPAVEPDRLAEFVLSQQRPDGGFVEIKQMRRSGTNPTAAAVGLLQIVGGVDDPLRSDVVEFLAEMQNDEGGLLANTRIPIADLLSTFTGALTLSDLNGLDQIDSAAVMRYAKSLEQPEGGFFGAAWDSVADVEYSFYGLGTLALFQSQ